MMGLFQHTGGANADLALAVYLFLAGAGLVMTWTLFFWQRSLNGNRRVPNWIIFVQAFGWSLFLVRSSYHLLFIQDFPPSWWLVAAVALMDAGYAGHVWAVLLRRKAAYDGGRREGAVRTEATTRHEEEST